MPTKARLALTEQKGQQARRVKEWLLKRPSAWAPKAARAAPKKRTAFTRVRKDSFRAGGPKLRHAQARGACKKRPAASGLPRA